MPFARRERERSDAAAAYHSGDVDVRQVRVPVLEHVLGQPRVAAAGHEDRVVLLNVLLHELLRRTRAARDRRSRGPPGRSRGGTGDGRALGAAGTPLFKSLPQQNRESGRTPRRAWMPEYRWYQSNGSGSLVYRSSQYDVLPARAEKMPYARAPRKIRAPPRYHTEPSRLSLRTGRKRSGAAI